MKLGWANVDALTRSLTAKQWFEWEAYAELEPFGEERDDWRAASIVAMIYNMAGKMAKEQKSIKDFVLPFGEQDEPVKKDPTPEELEKKFQMLLLMYSVPAKDT